MLKAVRVLRAERRIRRSLLLQNASVSSLSSLSSSPSSYLTSSSSTTQSTNKNPNERILAALDQARTTEYNRPDRNRYRIRALNKAIQEIGYLDEDLNSKEEVKKLILEDDVENLKGISPALKKALAGLVKMVRMQEMQKMWDPLSELIEGGWGESLSGTNEIEKTQSALDNDASIFMNPKTQTRRAKDEARSRMVHDLLSVPGLGSTTARHLVSLGVESVQQLRELLDREMMKSKGRLSSSSSSPSLSSSLYPISKHLTPLQQTNLKYLPHVIQPVTRDEIKRVYTLLKSLLPSHFQIECVGAYRRGFPISQRIDICLFHPLFHPEVKDVPTPHPSSASAFDSSSSIDADSNSDYLTNLSLNIPLPRKPSVYSTQKHSSKPDRRGRVDLAFRSPSTLTSVKRNSMFLNQVVPALKAGGLVALGDLAEISVGQWKWTGIVRVPQAKDANSSEEEQSVEVSREDKEEVEKPLESLGSRLRSLRSESGIFRKLDLSIAPLPSRATALLFLTGDVEFVRDMRMRANRMGLLLNEFGLWRWEKEEEEEEEIVKTDDETPPARRPSPGRPRLPYKAPQGKYSLLPTPTEYSLFASLGLDYIPPEKRNYSFLLSKYSKKSGRLRRGGEESAGMGVVLRS
ncbi:hypothetical protein J3R30DRAFT_3458675 [Lentinula aciculospora]|uniref:DNA-directed DNA polymerase X domain-containing protein n=1 Tax=Lentinula aciculospora TaxID=153920 RepID=A0A9W9AGN8_9AGAR|nr:hypothetical protein J3R30DRAFT_3458675 [Lentinula aciculospora]